MQNETAKSMKTNFIPLSERIDSYGEGAKSAVKRLSTNQKNEGAFSSAIEDALPAVAKMPEAARVMLGKEFFGLMGGAEEGGTDASALLHMMTGLKGSGLLGMQGLNIPGMNISGMGMNIPGLGLDALGLNKKQIVDEVLRELSVRAREDDGLRQEILKSLGVVESVKEPTPPVAPVVEGVERPEERREAADRAQAAPEKPAVGEPHILDEEADTLSRRTRVIEAARAYAATTILNEAALAGETAAQRISVYDDVAGDHARRKERSQAQETRRTEGAGLSAKYESGGDVAAIGWDRTGGTSYGLYQIATKTGTFDRFLGYLDSSAPEWAERLRNAGPADTGSTQGRTVDAWKSIAREEPERFASLQHDFIEKTHFQPAVERIMSSIGIDVTAGGRALEEVLWSTSVQHGAAGSTDIFIKAAGEALNSEDPYDVALIKEVYKEREKRFGSSDERVQQAVRDRFQAEEREALALLSPAERFSRSV
jgi:hypothetical protein